MKCRPLEGQEGFCIVPDAYGERHCKVSFLKLPLRMFGYVGTIKHYGTKQCEVG